jgi:hypothetical protein
MLLGSGVCLPADHPTATVFLDETGVVHSRPHDPYFGIGCLRLRSPGPLLLELHNLKQRVGLPGELHWADFDKATTQRRPELVTLAKDAIDLVFDSDEAFFACSIADRGRGDLTAAFRGHPHATHKAYERLAAQVLLQVLDDEEIVSVLADHVSTSPEVRFERDVARAVNDARGRLAVASVCRLDSRATVGLQLVDLLLGAATFDLRRGRTNGETQKEELMAHLLERCGCPSFRPRGKKGSNFHVRLIGASKGGRGGRGGR